MKLLQLIRMSDSALGDNKSGDTFCVSWSLISNFADSVMNLVFFLVETREGGGERE